MRGVGFGLVFVAAGLASGRRQEASVPDATRSMVVAGPAVQVAGGTHAVTVTVTLLDSTEAPVAGKQVTLSSVFGGQAAVPKASDASGVASFAVKDLVPRTDTYKASDTTDGVVLRHETTVRWVSATAADPGTSTAVVTPGPPPAAGNFARVTVKLTIENGVGTPLQGLHVGIATATGHVLTGSDSATDNNGTATLELRADHGRVVDPGRDFSFARALCA